VAHWDVLEKSDLLGQLRIDRGAGRPTVDTQLAEQV